MTLYRGYYGTCPIKGCKVSAATLLVLEQKLAKHVEGCAAREKKKTDEAAARDAQPGLLLDGGSR